MLSASSPDQPSKFLGPEGEFLDTVELESGGAVSFHVDGDQIVSDRPGYPAVPATHSARNIGADTFREVLIEFKV